MITRDVYTLHKMGHWCLSKKLHLLSKILGGVKRILYPASDIPFSADIGNGAYFAHRGIGVVIHSRAKIGVNCKIESNVTVGGTRGKGIPVIGDNCLLGAGSTIIGDITIGNDVIVGAGAVVVNDVKDGVIVAGVPARVINEVPVDWIGKPKT